MKNNPYKSISQLKRAITNEFQQFKNNDFDFITTEVVKRQKLCIQNMGDTCQIKNRHINYVLKYHYLFFNEEVHF